MTENTITSLRNARVKQLVKLRTRSHRDELGLLLIEGYRETLRALDNGIVLQTLFYCPDLYQGTNEPALVLRAGQAGAELLACTPDVFRKISYRDRPEGLLALAPQIQGTLDDLTLPDKPLLLIAEQIEKPGNLGTMLRSADAAGVDAVVVCDRCTDINNPNVVRASIGTLFCLPVVEADSERTLTWLRERNIKTAAATPVASVVYTDTDFSGALAVVVGAEQYGLSDYWLENADLQVRIPMLGKCDSLNVATAATLLLYEAVRQRHRGVRD